MLPGFGCHECTALIFPITPPWISFTPVRYVSWLWIWFPICVITFEISACRRICRTSHTVCASGFWQYTCLRIFIAAIATGACQWSGVEIVTASNWPLNFANISRQS